MTISASITIKAAKAAVWAATTDIAHFAQLLSGVEKIEIVERPATTDKSGQAGLVGLKWKETRMLFGKEATVEKWITEAKENEFYITRAEQDGFVFITTNRVSGSDGAVRLTGIHETQPQSLAAKLKALPMVFFKGVIKKAILQDLNDIKAAIEKPSIGDELAAAAFAGNLEEVTRLLDAGSDINGQGRIGNPLHAAIENDKVDCVRLLIARGADIEHLEHGGFTPLATAVDRAIDGTIQTGAHPGDEPTEIIQLLLEAGVKVEPGLEIARSYKSEKVLRLLEQWQTRSADTRS